MNPYKTPLLALIGLCFLLLALGIVTRPAETPPTEILTGWNPASEVSENPPVPSDHLPPTGGGGERRVTFATNMPKSGGTPMVDGAGGLDPAFVQVAVPKHSGGVEYLPGTDKRAIDYLASVRQNQALVIDDRGPAEVEDGRIAAGPLAGRQVRSVRVKIPTP